MKHILSVCLSLFCISSSFAQGFYSLYELNLEGLGYGTVDNYFQNGNTRRVVYLKSSVADQTTVTLAYKDTPNVEYVLHDALLTYETNDISKKPGFMEGDIGDFQITVLGVDTTDCYLSTHVKVVNLKTSTEFELWTSPDVEHYPDYLQLLYKYQMAGLANALIANRAPGFPVRIQILIRAGLLRLDLVRFAVQNNPASLFSLDGYSRVFVPHPTSSDGQ